MKLNFKLSVAALIIALAFGSLYAGGYKFTVTNNTKTKMTGLVAQEKGTTQWLPFNLGGGIKPGSTVTIEWSEHTDGTDCTWSIKAKYADGSESEPAAFDFCKETALEFGE